MAFACQYQDYPQGSPVGQTDVPSQEPAQEQLEKPKNNKKFIFIAVGLVLLAVVCFIFFFHTGTKVQSTEDEILKNYSKEWLKNTTETSENNVQNIMDASIKAQQTVSITTLYQCGSDICFGIKAQSSNTYAIPMNGTMYYINDQTKTATDWDGGISGTSCDSIATLTPGSACYGKIANINCAKGDIFKVTLVWGSSSAKGVICR